MSTLQASHVGLPSAAQQSPSASEPVRRSPLVPRCRHQSPYSNQPLPLGVIPTSQRPSCWIQAACLLTSLGSAFPSTRLFGCSHRSSFFPIGGLHDRRPPCQLTLLFRGPVTRAPAWCVRLSASPTPPRAILGQNPLLPTLASLQSMSGPHWTPFGPGPQRASPFAVLRRWRDTAFRSSGTAVRAPCRVRGWPSMAPPAPQRDASFRPGLLLVAWVLGWSWTTGVARRCRKARRCSHPEFCRRLRFAPSSCVGGRVKDSVGVCAPR